MLFYCLVQVFRCLQIAVQYWLNSQYTFMSMSNADWLDVYFSHQVCKCLQISRNLQMLMTIIVIINNTQISIIDNSSECIFKAIGPGTHKEHCGRNAERDARILRQCCSRREIIVVHPLCLSSAWTERLLSELCPRPKAIDGYDIKVSIDSKI